MDVVANSQVRNFLTNVPRRYQIQINQNNKNKKEETKPKLIRTNLQITNQQRPRHFFVVSWYRDGTFVH